MVEDVELYGEVLRMGEERELDLWGKYGASFQYL